MRTLQQKAACKEHDLPGMSPSSMAMPVSYFSDKLTQETKEHIKSATQAKSKVATKTFNETNLARGQEFSSYSEVLEALQAYQDINYVQF